MSLIFRELLISSDLVYPIGYTALQEFLTCISNVKMIVKEAIYQNY